MSGASVPMIFEGLPNVLPPGTRVGIAVARWNEPITRRLLAGAVHRLEAAGLPAAAVDVAWVPGSFELPLAADRLAATGRYAAVLCLGAIIRGETSHDRHIAQAAAAGIEGVGRARGLPVLAICRGIQELNVALGGTLHQLVQTLPGRLDHRGGAGTQEEC